MQVGGAITNGLQQWEVKLHRRVIGPYLLQVNYQTLVAAAGAGNDPARRAEPRT